MAFSYYYSLDIQCLYESSRHEYSTNFQRVSVVSVVCVCSPSRQNIIHTSTMLDISPIPSLTAMKDALRQESIRPCSNLLNRDITSSPLTMTIISFPIHHRRRRRRLGLAWAVPRLRLAETIRNRCQLSNNKPVLASRTVHS